jgi:catechol 2,3-dioxygenase-like lactoylglutathione lyase family enzyme
VGKDVIVTGLDHVNVTTPEELETEVLGWYGSVLGLDRLDKPPGSSPGGAWFRAGDKEVHIGVDPHNPPPSAHFCLTVKDFDAAVASLRSDGCHIEQAAEIAGRRRCFTRDPAGNRIELIAFDATP